MFGIFYALGLAIATIVSGTSSMLENKYQIDKAKKARAKGNNKYNIYTDRRGAIRDIESGQLRNIDPITVEKEGMDQYVRDIYGNPIRNLSAERRIERIQESSKDPKRTVSLWKEGSTTRNAGFECHPYCTGKQYRDLKNGNIYVCRMLSFPDEVIRNGGYGKFYMDIRNGLLVRECDSQKYDREKGFYEYSEDTCNSFIEYFNRKQKEGGCHPLARKKEISGWDLTENEFDKRLRLRYFYYNDKWTVDEPIGRKI